MKKLLVLTFVSSSLLVGSNSVKADWDYWAIDYDNVSGKNRIYTVDSDGTATLRTSKTLPGINPNDWEKENSFVDAENGLLKLVTKRNQAGNNTQTIQSYDLSTDTWTEIATPWNLEYDKVFERPKITENNDGSINVGTGDSEINITTEGIKKSGKNLIKQTSNGELHIGENSWITKEENGRQKVYAKDAAGNPIPIDYTNGTKLLINGRDVEQSINNVGALSAALTGLPTVPTDTTLACGFGTGTHGGDFAFAGGCASKVNETLSVNYAASMTMPGQDYAGDFEDTFSARAGFVWKLGKPVKPTLISMKEKKEFETQINTLEENNRNIIAQNKALIKRLEKLEKVALGSIQSKDLASNQIDFKSLNRNLKKNKL